MKIHIRNGRVIDPANNIDQARDLFVDDSQIIDPQLAGSDSQPIKQSMQLARSFVPD